MKERGDVSDSRMKRAVVKGREEWRRRLAHGKCGAYRQREGRAGATDGSRREGRRAEMARRQLARRGRGSSRRRGGAATCLEGGQTVAQTAGADGGWRRELREGQTRLRRRRVG